MPYNKVTAIILLDEYVHACKWLNLLKNNLDIYIVCYIIIKLILKYNKLIYIPI